MAAEYDLNEYVPIEFVRELGRLTLDSPHEEEFSEGLASLLLHHVHCDTVILRLLDRRIEVRAVATRDAVYVMPPGGLWEPFDEGEQRQWRGMADGVFCPDVHTSSWMKPSFRDHVADVGANSAFLTPLLHNGQLYGQLVYGWARPPYLDETARRHLRGVADIACYHLTTFWLRAANQYDALTGLRNRYGLERVWERRDKAQAGALMFVDLDGFKTLVDTRGHAAGDEYLHKAAETLQNVVPVQGTVFRIGADEFVVLLSEMTSQGIGALADEVRAAFQRFARDMPPPRPSVTIGVARFPHDAQDLDRLMAVADERMRSQRSKRSALTSILPFPTTVSGTASDRPGGEPQRPAPLPIEAATLPDGGFSQWLDDWPDGILMTSPDFKVMYVNRAYEKMSGYSLAEWLGQKPSLVSSGKTSPKTYEQMWKSINETGTWTGHVINRRRDGTEWVSLLSIIRIVTGDGRLAGYLANARDVSHSLWKDEPSIQDPFQEAFTQEALAFALAEAGQIHEGGSRRHLERMRDYTRLLVIGAMEQGYAPLQRYETRTAVVMASILHDIGKLAVPEGLLRKPARLSPIEYELIKTHTIAGEQLLRSPYLSQGVAAPESKFLSTAATIARSHHERWDGKGYPDGLTGDAIPLEARIVAIADVYDALRSSRAYKAPWKHEAAVEYIAQAAGTQFDPGLVDIFVSFEAEFDDIAREISVDQDVRTDGQTS